MTRGLLLFALVSAADAASLYDYHAKSMAGSDLPLAYARGKPTLMVNVASR